MQSHLAGSNESEFLYHLPCPTCGSSDANSMYDDGHTYCFVCNARTTGEEPPSSSTTASKVMMKGTPVALKRRGLTEDTCRKYRITKDGDVLRFHYFDKAGRVVAAKVKTKDKSFSWDGKNVDNQLFGQQLFPNRQVKNDALVLYEGELDAASGWQALQRLCHMSVPNGAKGAKKALQHVIDLTQGYDEIILFFDHDPEGISATEECAALLPPGKVKIARMEKYKDASEALQAGDSTAIRRAITHATTYVPGGIVDAKSLLSLITTPEPPCAHEYPFKGLNEKFHGIRYGELITVTAGTGSGKTSFCRQLATHLLSEGERVGVVELEANNKRTALGLMSCALGKAYHIGEHDQEELDTAYRNSIADWNLFMFDGFGSFDPDIIYNRLEYLATGLDVKVIFLDHISILMSGLDGDERRMLDQTMTRLRSLVERTNISLFLVSHVRRTHTDQAHEEGARVNIGQLRGSHSIGQLSDGIIALERDQQADRGKTDTTVRVLKNRYCGELGVACNLKYDLTTCKFNEVTTGDSEPEFDATTDF